MWASKVILPALLFAVCVFTKQALEDESSQLKNFNPAAGDRADSQPSTWLNGLAKYLSQSKRHLTDGDVLEFLSEFSEGIEAKGGGAAAAAGAAAGAAARGSKGNSGKGKGRDSGGNATESIALSRAGLNPLNGFDIHGFCAWVGRFFLPDLWLR